MEAEYNDIRDRNLLGLYGISEKKPEVFDHKENSKFLKKQNKKTEDSQTTPKPENFVNLELAKDEEHSQGSLANSPRLSAAGSDERAKISNNPKISSPKNVSNVNFKTIQDKTISTFDDIRETSGRDLPRNMLPISLDQTCLQHQTSAHDKQLTMKLFKTACLAYNPSKVLYRDQVMERGDLINMRRALMDQVTNMLPSCEIFKTKGHYPKRYFHDLAIVDKGLQEQLKGIKSINEIGRAHV